MAQTTTFTLTMGAAIRQAQKIVKKPFLTYDFKQFFNQKNEKIHIDKTAEKIWQDKDRTVYIVVIGVEVGGTITSISEVIKIRKPNFKAISPKGMRFAYAIEATSSPVLSRGSPGTHKIQGIAEGFVRQILKVELIDSVINVTD